MIKVLQPGLFTTVQDLGRFGFQAFGVPVAGAMDEYSARVANLLVGNGEDLPLLEFTMFGGSYEFSADTLIALTGAEMKAKLNGKEIANWASQPVTKGEILELSFAERGCRSYLAVAGGLEIRKVMGSASTHTRSQLGGLQGRALQKGDFLAFSQSAYKKISKLPQQFQIDFAICPAIKVLPGPQAGAFTSEALEVLQTAEYLIEADSDRMGYRLSGPKLAHQESADIISDALFKGAVQVPGSGQPIIMMADCQTTGGYTKLCFVLTADLNVLAQCKPGDKIKFQVVDEEQATVCYEEYRSKLAQVKAYLAGTAERERHFLVRVNGTEYQVKINSDEE